MSIYICIIQINHVYIYIHNCTYLLILKCTSLAICTYILYSYIKKVELYSQYLLLYLETLTILWYRYCMILNVCFQGSVA